MRLNWFTPLPPAPTAIGATSTRILSVLARHADLTVWTDREDYDPSLLKGFEIRICREMDAHWPEVNFADATIYNIGNDARFHRRYVDFLERHPGIVVLHDYNLHELHRERFIREAGGRARFRRFVLETAGIEALETVLRFEEGDISFEEVVEAVPLIESITRHATGIIAFNKAMRPGLEGKTGCPMMFCPLPLESADTLPPLQKRQFDRGGPLRLAMYGFLNSPNRRLQEVLEAVSKLKHAPVDLTLFGHIEDREGFFATVARLGLENQVSFRGYVEEEELAEILVTSHLVINLRNPTRGESSDALLRAWKYSLPTLVTQTGYYTTIPEELVCPVPPGQEVQGILRHVEAFLADPETYFAIGERAYAYLRDYHTTEAFVDHLMTFLNSQQPYQGSAFAQPYARSLGRRMGEDFQGRAWDHLQERCAGELVYWSDGKG